MIAGEELAIFDHVRGLRDYTYVDDAVDAHAPGSLQTPGVVVVLQPQSRRAGPVRLLVLGLDQPD